LPFAHTRALLRAGSPRARKCGVKISPRSPVRLQPWSLGLPALHLADWIPLSGLIGPPDPTTQSAPPVGLSACGAPISRQSVEDASSGTSNKLHKEMAAIRPVNQSLHSADDAAMQGRGCRRNASQTKTPRKPRR
jgi:hypothetical protein